MGRQREGERIFLYRRAIFCGFGAAACFLILVFAVALFSESQQILFRHAGISVKVCLAVCALLCAILSAGKAQKNRLLYALTGEGILLAGILVVGMTLGFQGGRTSMAADLGIMLIGAFAGAISRGGIKRKRRGKR